MITRTKQFALAATAAISLTACAENYAVEGAGAGAAGGYFIDKNDGCDGYDRNGKLDDDCYGLRGYPDDPR